LGLGLGVRGRGDGGGGLGGAGELGLLGGLALVLGRHRGAEFERLVGLLLGLALVRLRVLGRRFLVVAVFRGRRRALGLLRFRRRLDARHLRERVGRQLVVLVLGLLLAIGIAILLGSLVED